MKNLSVAVGIGVLSAFAVPAQAQQITQPISKQSVNFNNIPPCPGRSSGATIGFNTFTDHTPLPSCGGRETSGPNNSVVKTYQLVWTGHVWAEYLPSVKVTNVPPPTPPADMIRPMQPSQFRYSSTQLGLHSGQSPSVGSTITYQGKQYRITEIIDPNGKIVSTNGGSIISSSSPYNVVMELITNDGGTLRR
jgi:hypothetical protein